MKPVTHSSIREHPVLPTRQAVTGSIESIVKAKHEVESFNENEVGRGSSPLCNSGSRLRNQELIHAEVKTDGLGMGIEN